MTLGNDQRIPPLDDQDLGGVNQERASNKVGVSEAELTEMRTKVLDAVLTKDPGRIFAKDTLNMMLTISELDPAHFSGVVRCRLSTRMASELTRVLKKMRYERESPSKQQVRPDPGEDFTGALIGFRAKGPPRLVAQSVAAILLGRATQDKLAYAANGDLFYTYEDDLWKCCTDENTGAHDRTLLALIDNGVSPVKDAGVYTRIEYSLGFVDGSIKLAKRGGRFRTPRIAKDVIAFKNGLLLIHSGEMVQPTPEFATTWRLPHAYSPDASCAFFREWLAAVVGDTELVDVVLAAVNKALTGRSDIHRFIELLGVGGAGKSTLLRVLTAVFGRVNTRSTTIDALENNKFETFNLIDKRLLMIPDIEKYRGKVANLKCATGGDPLRLEQKHVQHSADYVFDGLVVISANENQFGSEDYSSGLARRKLVLPFRRRWTEAERVDFEANGGEARLFSEVPGIIAAALAMSDDEVANILNNPPATALKATFDDLADSNSIVAWVRDNLVYDAEAATQIGKLEDDYTGGFPRSEEWLYPNYRAWAKSNNEVGARYVTLRDFAKNLVEMVQTMMGFELEHCHPSNKSTIKGIRLRKDGEDPFKWLESL